MKIDTRNLKAQFEENPTMVLAAVGFVTTGVAKLLKVGIEAKNSRTWAKEVKRREKTSRR